jgi:hypothetical protein
VGEQVWLVLIDLLQPVRCPGVLAAEPFELVHGPPDEVLVDAPCALCGSTVMEEAWQRGVLGSRLDLEEHPALHDEGAVAGRGDPDCACRGGVPLAPPADQSAALLIERLLVKAP